MHSRTSTHQQRTQLRLLLGAALAALVLAAAASADSLQPITIGPINVANGTVTANANGGSTTAGGTVTINGQPASIDANGNITANIDLTGQSTLTLGTTDPTTGKTTTTTIPVTLIGPGGVIPASVFDQLRQAGVTIAVPPAGFAAVPGQPLHVSGSIADKSNLAGLTVNGVDALSLLKPDGTFTVPVPGSDKTVVVTATDHQGIAESSSYKITPLKPSTRTSATSVSAASATGVSITSVRYLTRGVKTRKRISVTVTVKDKNGRLIRGAKVRVRPASFQHSYVIGGQTTTRTNATGHATLTLKLRAAKFTQRRRLFTVTTALTPSAHTTRTTSVRLPKLRTHH